MIRNLVITQLVENTAGGPGLLAEHGVSFHIEADGHSLLFDTGQGFALRHNAKQLDLQLDRVEKIILSHGHYDHAGGLFEALELTGPVDLYVHPKASGSKYNRNGREIGTNISDKRLVALIKRRIDTLDPMEIVPGIHVTGQIPRTHDIEDTGGPFYQDAGCTLADHLPDDQALYIESKSEGLVVLLGCGHSGVVNTLEYIQQLSAGQPIRALIGGMHLLRASPERLAFTADYLAQRPIGYLAPNHCTGLDAVCYFKGRFPEVFHESKAGTGHFFIDP